MWFINNISKSKITSLVLLLSLFLFLFLLTNRLGALIVGSLSPHTLQRLIQTTKVTKFSFPVSVFAALSCIPLLNVFRLLQVGSRSFWYLPSSNLLSFLFALPPPTSPQKGESGWSLFLFWMLSYHTGALQGEPGDRDSSLHHSWDAESQTQSRKP